MKSIYMIGGPMGVGKTTVGQIMQKKLDCCAFLDGDWCWDMHPFTVTEETKQLALDNIGYLLTGFLRCTACENIVFAWVMHEQRIIDVLSERLSAFDCRILPVSLVCDAETLTERLRKDVSAGLREPDVIERSLRRLPCYAGLRTVKIDVSRISAAQAAEQILQLDRGDYEKI